MDIRSSDDTAPVMVNGRLINAGDLSEIGGKQRPAPEFFWQRAAAACPGPPSLTASGPGSLIGPATRPGAARR